MKQTHILLIDAFIMLAIDMIHYDKGTQNARVGMFANSSDSIQ